MSNKEIFEGLELFRSAISDYFGEKRPQATAKQVRAEGGFLPVDMYETDKEVIVKTVIPGVLIDAISITVTENTLAIRASIPSDAEREEATGWRWLHHELGHGNYSRTLTLPQGLDMDKAEATYEEGFLTIRIPLHSSEVVKEVRLQVREPGSGLL